MEMKVSKGYGALCALCDGQVTSDIRLLPPLATVSNTNSYSYIYLA